MTSGQSPRSTLSTTKAQVEQVVDIMKENFEKVHQRGDEMEKLGQRTSQLEDSAKLFETSAGKLKDKYYWKNVKVKITELNWV